MAKDGEDKKTQKLLEYECVGNEKVTKNTTLTTVKTHIGYKTELRYEYNTINNAGTYKHVVSTGRESIPDIKKWYNINLSGQWHSKYGYHNSYIR